jgi:hypothetical protein
LLCQLEQDRCGLGELAIHLEQEFRPSLTSRAIPASG